MLNSHAPLPRSVLLAAALTLAVAGCSSGGTSGYGQKPSTPPSKAVVTVRTVGKLGSVLVDGTGRTLYLFLKDTSSTSSCSGACAQAWPPLTTTGMPTAGSGARAALIGTTMRSDGTTQVTYHGHPLYLYASDSQPGQANGEGLNQYGAEWYVLSAAGDKVENEGGNAPTYAPTYP